MISGNYGHGDDDSGGAFATASSGNYKTDPKTGLFEPNYTKPQHIPGITGGINNMVRALMTGYLRKQAGTPTGMTSAAPSSILQATKGVDPYSSYGVPYTGIQYGGASGGSPNPYSSIFSPAPSSTDY